MEGQKYGMLTCGLCTTKVTVGRKRFKFVVNAHKILFGAAYTGLLENSTNLI
jgi:hypothetical protein